MLADKKSQLEVLVGHCTAKEQQQAVKLNALQVVLQQVLKGTNNCH